MDFVDLKNKGEKELREILATLRAQARELRFRALSRQLKQVHKVNDLRKTIARIQTLLKLKQK